MEDKKRKLQLSEETLMQLDHMNKIQGGGETQGSTCTPPQDSTCPGDDFPFSQCVPCTVLGVCGCTPIQILCEDCGPLPQDRVCL